ncbi:L-threonylcarbamoyladenylate synthase [Azohydromonas caseinilytica]|uniref:Threonylcarbamoyl-AMP synthase n=1 Tax=Azohydromonas caseinilytica TaxID=2728836 RepID=A0A848F4V0_9BURK|nr:L-threonylcarbamoyladenylate synthase [Azohydromonas caseinilytica]NML13656.1 threonylcarbamoyl-AMP synthase [Azohydromonas caseinilytica]
MPLLDGTDPQAIAQAAALLAAGELVALPTETVYGLGARADQDAAVAKIFAAKGRPSDHPLIVHVSDAAEAPAFTPAADQPMARRLMDAFWPGPLTLILPRREGVAAAAAGGQSSIGLRCPAHPVAHALLQAAARLGVPGVAAPSANRFGRISPTTAAHVQGEFGEALAVLDGGACAVGIESTIVDLTREHPVLLRPGVLTPAQIEAVCGEPLRARDAQAPRASGTLEAHYAPRAPLRLLDAQTLRQALAVPPEAGMVLALYSRSVEPPPGVLHRRMPDDARAAAFELFAVLREFDALGAALIWVEQPPPAAEWDGVRDRLQRAAAAA